MDRNPSGELACPYCGRPLAWVPQRWFGRGCFECERCGEFADFRPTSTARARDRSEPRPVHVPKPSDRLRVLLVDDAPEQRDLYALMLESTATVITASRGEHALAIAHAEPLDAIVLDVLMPGMDGWEVCRRLKADRRTSRIPVIMLTSLDQDELSERGQDAGIAAALTKPCPVERLALAIERAVGESTAAAAPPAASAFLVSRRWTRKPVRAPIVARVGDQRARLVNISYGGLCVAIDEVGPSLPWSFDVAVGTPDVLVHADAVWMARCGQRRWMFGAEVSGTADDWRRLVDSVA